MHQRTAVRYKGSVTHRFPALIAAPPAVLGQLWLPGARLFDGIGAALRENTAVLIEDSVIRRVADDREALARSKRARGPRIASGWCCSKAFPSSARPSPVIYP